jgi:hypothetical protein
MRRLSRAWIGLTLCSLATAQGSDINVEALTSDPNYIDVVHGLHASSASLDTITVSFNPAESGYDTSVTIHPEEGHLVDPGNRENRTWTGLESGKLYTFIAVKTDGIRKSEPVTINQDTIPLPPESLALETFEVLTVEVTFFGSIVPHRIDTSGILAQWSPPTHGHCDCYDAVISPDEGLRIEPKDEGGEQDRGAESRQFIHLVPGKEYAVTVWSTTCGNGDRGPLPSEKLVNKIRVPPQSPGKVKHKDRGADNIEVCFPGPNTGHFTGFEFEWESDDGARGDAMYQVYGHTEEHAWSDPNREFCYNLEGLRSCTSHRVEVRTVYYDARSVDFARFRSETLPLAPTGAHMTNFGHNSVNIAWNNPGDALGYRLKVKPSDTNITNIANPHVRIENLEPGTTHDFEIQAYCMMTGERKGKPIEYQLWSLPETFSQATQPNPPASINAVCTTGKGTINMEKENKPKRANDEFSVIVNQVINLNLEWEVPEDGDWDGFVVTYSPFVDYADDDSLNPPFTYGSGTTQAKIPLPRADQTYTIYVRAISGAIESEPMTIDVDCGQPAPVFSCTETPDETLDIDLGKGFVEINLQHLALPDSLFGSLISAPEPNSPRLEFRGDGGKTVVISSERMNCQEVPCNAYRVNFDVCTAGFGCQPRFSAAACPCQNRGDQIYRPRQHLNPDPISPGVGARGQPRPGHVAADACCGVSAYNTEVVFVSFASLRPLRLTPTFPLFFFDVYPFFSSKGDTTNYG